LAVIPSVLLALYLLLAASPPSVRAEAYPHLGARTLASDRRAARTHASALNHRAPPPPAPLRGNPAHSILSLEAMQRFFYIQGSGLYREELYATPSSYLFPFSQALAATVSASNIPRQAKTLAGDLRVQLYGLQKYFKENSASSSSPGQSPQARRASYTAAESGGTSYYDDNEWVGIELMRIYKLDHNRAALAQAEQIMSFVMAGWQTNPNERCPGGVPFSDSSPGDGERNAVTNAPAAELGVQLYRITHNLTYLQFAEMAYGWVRQCLLEPTNLYADHLEGQEGEVEPTEWSYNQGSMIGAGALLYQSTRQRFYLEQATATAHAAAASFPLERLAGESPFFPAVFLRNLLYLDSLTHESTARSLAQSYVDYVCESPRLGSGLFLLGNGANPQLLEQATIAQIYALLSTSPSSYF
jgi:Glycosyl hydrolase family 76